MNSIKNSVQLVGHIGKDPIITVLDDGKKIARFQLATNENYVSNDEKHVNTNWHSIVAWNKTAVIIENHLNKGDHVAIQGKLVSRSYNDKDGNKRYITEVKVREILMLK